MNRRKQRGPAGIAGIVLVAILASSFLSAREAAWLKFSQGAFTVYVPSSADLGKLYGNLSSRALTPLKKAAPDASRAEKAALLAERIDEIFKKVQELGKVKIRTETRGKVVILRDNAQLAAVFRSLYQREYREGGYAFYSPSRNTIYITTHAFCTRILAHEMTHMVNRLHYRGTLAPDKDEESAYRMEVHF